MPTTKRSEKFSLKKYTNSSGTASWRISGTKNNGFRVRENFQNKTDAINRRAELEIEDTKEFQKTVLRPTTLSEAQLFEAETAFTELKGHSLSNAISTFLRLNKLAESTEQGVDAVLNFATAYYRPETNAITVMNACERYLQSKQDAGVFPKTIEGYRHSIGLLVKSNPNEWLHDFSVTEIEQILSKYKNPNSRATHQRAISSFFEWAVKRHHLLENPCKRLEKPASDRTTIRILTLEECRKFLKAAMLYRDGAFAAIITIQLFAGLRPSEAQSLSPADIRPDGIRVKGGKLRRTANRKTPIPEILAQWLEAFPFQKVPTNHRNGMREIKAATKSPNWVQDIIRHTSISYQLERDQNEALVAFNNGTSLRMINRHYREIIDKSEDVEEFWNLTPDKIKKHPLTLPKKNAPRKINWPENKDLLAMLKTMPMTTVAKKIGVSDNAVRKRLKKL